MARTRPRSVANAHGLARTVLSRGVAFSLLTLAILFAVTGHRQDGAVANVEIALTDAMAPVLDGIARPMETIGGISDRITELGHLSDENAQLRAEREALLQWEARARDLETENQRLRGLLNFVPDPQWRYVTARVITDDGSTFVHSVLIAAGKHDGVQSGQPAVTGEGLAGRVVEAGGHSARILLVTDINSRVPVVIQRTGVRAIMAGDNSPLAKLLYLPVDAKIAVGDRVVTSAYGGSFPADIPVGTVASVTGGTITVAPFVDTGRLGYLRLIDHDLGARLQELSGRAGSPDQPDIH